ncbi:MAG: hypothetical protein ACO1NU_05745 [Arcticibacter sp.]
MAAVWRFFVSFWKWILIILLILLMILAGGAWYLSSRWKPLLDTQLKQLVLNSSDSLYRVEYTDLKINLISGKASLKNLKLIPNEDRYKELERLKRAPDNMYNLQVESFDLVNFHPKRLYDSRKLNVDKIVIDHPKMIITNKRQPYNRKADTVSKKSLYQMISKSLREVRINDIQLKDIDFVLINRSTPKEKKTAIRNLNLTVTDFLLDSLSEKDKNRFYHTRNVDVELKDYKIATADSLYFLRFKSVKFSTKARSLVMDDARMQPRYNIPGFYRKVKMSKDRFDIRFNQIVLKGIDLEELKTDQRFFASRMVLADGKVGIYNTNALPKKVESKSGKFPHQQLQKLALDLRIDTLQLRRIQIAYQEFNKKTGKTGTVFFANTRGAIYNITNDPGSLKKNRFMRAELSTLFLKKANLHVTFNFNLTDKAGAFTSTGTLGAMNGTALNQVTNPLAMINVNSLNVRKLQFNIRANERLARGTVRFYYSNLNIQLLKINDETGRVEKQGLVSGIANTFVLNEGNPDPKNNNVFTVGTIYLRRPPSFAFFKFYWKSLLEGVKESVGVSREKENRIKTVVSKVGEVVSGVKSDFEALKDKMRENKQERIKKRELKKKEKALKKAQEEKEEAEEKKQEAKKDSVAS